MDIKKYTSDFHDGELININHVKDEIELTLSSAEVDPKDIPDLILGTNDRIKGKLHLIGVKSVKINNKFLTSNLEMQYHSGEILHLEIKSNQIKIEMLWRDNDFHDRGYSEIEIDADNIYWENIPNLSD